MSNTWAARNARHTLRIADGKSTWHPRVRPETAERLPRILRRRARRSWLTAITLSLLTSLASAQVADDEVASTGPGQMQAGSLLLKMKSGYAVATRLSTDISAEISGLAARVRVKQEFRNSGSEWVEGVYVFPLPDTAAVDRLRMHIGERYIEGEIREKAEAKKAYEAAKAAGKKASLVQQERANMFTTSVANIAPGETVVIEIEYLETLQVDAEMFSIRFPVTITPRYIPGTPVPGRRGSGWSLDTDQVVDASRITPPIQPVTKDHKLSFDVRLNSAVPLEYIASRYHPANVNRKEDQYAIDLVDSDTPMDHDIELTWKAIPDTAPRAMLFTETVEDETYALMMLLPPDVTEDEPQTHTARELILIIDTSGSMHGTSLEQAQGALTLALDGLRPTDQFNVIQFNSVTSVLFQSSVAASTTNIATAKRYVSGLTANGGTEMRAAIERAMAVSPSEEYLRQIIFITDGSVGNEDALFSLIEQRLGNARLFTVGIGSAPNSWFMRKAAEAGRGTFTFISALHEVNEKMQRLFRKIERPQITDIKIQWPDGASVESFPKTVSDLYVGEPVFVRARLTHAMRASGLITVSGNAPSGTWSAELPVTLGQHGPGIGVLWARARIENLMDELRHGAQEELIRPAIIKTALAHHLVSKFTSLVAIDKTPVRPVSENLKNEQVSNQLPYGQSMNEIYGFPATATGAAGYRLSGLAILFLALLVLRVLRKEPDDVSRKMD